MDNPNFLSVELYNPKMTLEEILDEIHTRHFNEERMRRFRIALRENNEAEIDQSFLVDKGHPDGPEIHSVSKNAVIFIVNANTKRFITVLLARPGQVRRLYKECNIKLPQEILKKSKYFIDNKLNLS